MKSFSIILVAMVLFGLCLVEKELKQRAVDALTLGEDLTKIKKINLGTHQIPEAILVKQDSPSNEFWPSKLPVYDLAITDTTSHRPIYSLVKPL